VKLNISSLLVYQTQSDHPTVCRVPDPTEDSVEFVTYPSQKARTLTLPSVAKASVLREHNLSTLSTVRFQLKNVSIGFEF
jgi:hypothetical protein